MSVKCPQKGKEENSIDLFYEWTINDPQHGA